jgi:MFS family permease
MISARDDERVIAGALLIVGSLLFFVAIVFIGGLADPNGRSIVSLPDEARLPLIAANAGRWEWGWAFGISGIVVTVFGLVVLEAVLRSAGDSVLARLGLTAFLFGAVLTVAGRAQEVSIAVWAARATAAGAPIPTLLAPIVDWANAMTAVYTALAFAALAAFGGSILTTGVLSRGVGWAAVGWGVGWGLVFVVEWIAVGGFDYPVLHHVMPLVIGLALLRQTLRERRSLAEAVSKSKGGGSPPRTAGDRDVDAR